MSENLRQAVFDAVVERSDDAIIAKDADGFIAMWNRGAERLFGYSAAEAIGRPGSILVPGDRFGDEEVVLRRVMRGEPVDHYETRRRRKDGSTIEVSLTLSPLRDAAGLIVGMCKIARDLTARRKADAALRRTEEQLLQAQKMEAVGRLAGGVAHDFNNLLSVVLSYAGVMLGELGAADPLRQEIEEIHKAGERAAELTRQLLAFSRKQVLQPRVVDLNQILLGAERMLKRVVGEDVDLSLLTGSSLGRIFADPGQIEQVVMNLIVNARDAMPDGGKLSIETENRDLDESYAALHRGVTPGPYVMLAVSDTGTGMDAATRQRIFEPFFTTKGNGRGTGLGLSTVFGIVQQSGGHIWVYSEPGQGTTFRIYFPRTARPISTDEPAQTQPAKRLTGAETVLVVEDDEALRRTVRLILRRHGYNVLEAPGGGDALLICEQYAATIHLLLTDVVMPRMNGRQLAERLRKERPKMKVLYVSGYTENSVVHHGILDAGIEYLQKPLTPEPLLRKVREVLDAGGRDDADS